MGNCPELRQSPAVKRGVLEVVCKSDGAHASENIQVHPPGAPKILEIWQIQWYLGKLWVLLGLSCEFEIVFACICLENDQSLGQSPALKRGVLEVVDKSGDAPASKTVKFTLRSSQKYTNLCKSGDI